MSRALENDETNVKPRFSTTSWNDKPKVPTMKNAQQKVKSHILVLRRNTMISRKEKFDSESRGPFLGSCARINSSSFAVSHLACGGTVVLVSTWEHDMELS
jgi:hypothetical protein